MQFGKYDRRFRFHETSVKNFRRVEASVGFLRNATTHSIGSSFGFRLLPTFCRDDKLCWLSFSCNNCSLIICCLDFKNMINLCSNITEPTRNVNVLSSSSPSNFCHSRRRFGSSLKKVKHVFNMSLSAHVLSSIINDIVLVYKNLQDVWNWGEQKSSWLN